MRYGSGSGSQFHVPFPLAGYLRSTTRNVERISTFLKSYDPDIVGLVEIDSGSIVRCARRSQAEEIARALGHYHCYRSKYGPGSLAHAVPLMKKQGNAILTREDTKAVTCHYFTRGVKRLVLEVALSDVNVFLVHLSIRYRHRQEQLNSLYEMLAKVRKPHIVAGDFNAFWGDKEIQLFLAATGLCNASSTHDPSYPSYAPRHQLDFILHSPGIRVTHFEVPRIQLSDHFPLVCDFEIAHQ